MATFKALAAAPSAPLDGPRPAAAVIDATGILGQDDVERLERLAADVRQASSADMMTVLIPTTNGQPHRAFATDLFNRWQLGAASRDDGLLIFIALDDRKAEIILGDGVDSPEQIAASQRIMNEVLIPEFKRGRPATGLRKTAFACAAEILGAGAEDPVPAMIDEAANLEPALGLVPPPAARGPRPVGGRGADGIMPYALGGGGVVGGVGLSWYLLRRHLRNRPRPCTACRVDMLRLGEAADDAHLTSGQKFEESIRSVDYDVWTCPTCPRVDKIRYAAFFTSYAKCPKCGSLTRSRTVSRVQSPTNWSSGLENIREGCGHCGYTTTSTRVIPRLATDDSSFWASSSGSGSSSSDSSSSGGGHSSGSGASGSW